MEVMFLYLLTAFVTFVLFSLQILLYKHRSNLSGPNLPPGKIGWTIIGETLEFLSNGWKGETQKFVFDRMEKFSQDCFKTSILGEPVAVFCGAAGNKFLFSNENKLVVSWWPSSVNKVFPSSLQKSDSKEEAKRMRKLLPQFLKPEEAPRGYIDIMDNIGQRHIASSWENAANQEVTVFPLAKKITFWVACRLFLSVEDPKHIARFANQLAYLASGIISVPIDLPGTPFNRAIRAAEFSRKELGVIIRQRKAALAEGKATPDQDILSHMLNTTDEEGQFMNELEIADKILGLLIGGHNTASATITFIVKYLAELPRIYEAVYEEQMEIAKAKCPGEPLNWEDLQKMKYSWNVAREAMRLAPPLQGAFREILHEFMHAGFSIPKGWKIYWSANTTHRDPDCFPEPEKIDPSRFEGSGPAPYTFVPFGGGPRMCPGKEYARLEILVFMHNLVKRFRWQKLVPDENFVVNPMPTPVKGLPIRFTAHN